MAISIASLAALVAALPLSHLTPSPSELFSPVKQAQTPSTAPTSLLLKQCHDCGKVVHWAYEYHLYINPSTRETRRQCQACFCARTDEQEQWDGFVWQPRSLPYHMVQHRDN